MVPLSPELHVALQDEVKAAYQKQHPGSLQPTANQVAVYFNVRHKPPLAEATVHRFFNCASPTQPGTNTLNVLAKYAGFDDYADYARHFEEQHAVHLRGSRPQRLGQSYGLMQRLRGETGTVLAASLRAVASAVCTPAGQDDWVQAWVDLAHLPGYYGQLLDVYAAAVRSTEAQLFAGGLRYLKALLTENQAECQTQAQLLGALDPRASAPAFALGRWAFARLMQRFADAPGELSAAELNALRAQAPVLALAAGGRRSARRLQLLPGRLPLSGGRGAVFWASSGPPWPRGSPKPRPPWPASGLRLPATCLARCWVRGRRWCCTTPDTLPPH